MNLVVARLVVGLQLLDLALELLDALEAILALIEINNSKHKEDKKLISYYPKK